MERRQPRESFPEAAQRIEKELTDRIARIHYLTGLIPSRNFYEALRAEKVRGEIGVFHSLIAELTVISKDFELLFMGIPPNYFLELEISHDAYSDIADPNLPQVKAEREGNVLRYHADCGVFMDASDGRSSIYLKATLPDGRHVMPYLMLKQTGTGPLEDNRLNLRDIANARVLRIPGTFKPIPIPGSGGI